MTHRLADDPMHAFQRGKVACAIFLRNLSSPDPGVQLATARVLEKAAAELDREIQRQKRLESETLHGSRR